MIGFWKWPQPGPGALQLDQLSLRGNLYRGFDENLEAVSQWLGAQQEMGTMN
jgi:hypothetical protein